MKELVNEKFNEDKNVEQSVVVKIENGMFVASAGVDAKKAGVAGDLVIKFKPQLLGNLIKKAIPGKIDDMLIDAAMKALEEL